MTNPWPRALTHVGVTVTDLDKAVRWYGEILGLLFPDQPYKIAYCEDPFGNTIELYSHSTEQTWGNR